MRLRATEPRIKNNEGAFVEDVKQMVVCVGNMLLLDEGFGSHMAKVLTDYDTARESFDEEHARTLTNAFRLYDTNDDESDARIPVLDAGTMGLSLIPYIRDFDRLVIVDVVDCGPEATPGTCYTFTPEDMATYSVMHSLHDMRVSDVLTNARLAGHDCEIRCVGVQKKNIAPEELTIGLTPEVAASIPYATSAILELLELELSE